MKKKLTFVFITLIFISLHSCGQEIKPIGKWYNTQKMDNEGILVADETYYKALNDKIFLISTSNDRVAHKLIHHFRRGELNQHLNRRAFDYDGNYTIVYCYFNTKHYKKVMKYIYRISWRKKYRRH